MGIEQAVLSATLREGDGCKAGFDRLAGLMEILVDVEGVEGRVEGAKPGTEAQAALSSARTNSLQSAILVATTPEA